MTTAPFGVCLRLATAQAANARILEKAQNGGAVTALLTYALENEIIDGAIISTLNKEKPLDPIPKLATTLNEIIENAGTRYTYSPNIQALPQITEQDRHAVAFVGTPCQIRAARKMHQTNPNSARRIKLLIGLMCTEAFTYQGLVKNHFQNVLDIDPADILKVEIKGKMTITTHTGKTTIPLADIKRYIHEGCSKCGDFSSELADISAGSLGLPDWTFIVVRTETGEQVFSEAEQAGAILTRPIRKGEPALKLLMKLSATKHERKHDR